MVTPDDALTVTAGSDDDSRQYTVTNAVADTEHRIELFNADEVSIDANGVVTFEAQGDTGVDAMRADTGTVDSRITVVNGSATGGVTFDEVEPVGGQISFTVEGVGFESVVPVVWFDDNSDNSLNVDADGAPVDAEAFGVGGQLDVLPGEAATGVDFNDSEIVGVFKAGNFIVVDRDNAGDLVTVNYAEGDSFFVVDTGSDVDSLANQATFAESEAALTVGDNLGASTEYSRNFDSKLVLNNVEPVTPVIDSFTATDTEIEVTLTGVRDDASARIYVAAEDGDFDDAVLSVESATDEDDDTTGFQITVTGLTAETTYELFATQIVDAEESGVSTAETVPTLSPGQVATLVSNTATVTDVNNLLGLAVEDDVFVIGFNRPIADPTDAAIAVRDADGNATVVTDGVGTTTFETNVLTSTFEGETYAPGELLTITLGVDLEGDVSTDALEYPLTITNRSGITADGVATNTWDLSASADVTLNVDETADVAALVVSAADSSVTSVDNEDGTATLTATVENSNGDGLEGLAEADFDVTGGLTTDFAHADFASFSDDGDGTYTVDYNPAANGTPEVTITVNGVDIEVDLTITVTGN